MRNKLLSQLKKIALFCKEGFIYFFAVDGTIKAAALTYATLISIVPLMVLSFGFLSVFPAFKVYFQELHGFLFRHLVPASASIIQEYTENFAANATELSATSLIFTFLTAIILIFSMETVFNSIWRVRVRRKGLSAFLMYWAILTLLPPVGVITIALTMFLYSLPFFGIFLNLISFVIPLLFSWLGFLFLYMSLPNCKVYFRHASIGAAVAACLFELMKIIFRVYVSNFSSDTIIYGVIAAIPVFLLWLYLTWINVIIGAIISFKISLGLPTKDTHKIVIHH